MIKITTAALALALTVVSTSSFSATDSTARIDQRQENQQKRIDQGTKSGALTEKEAARLEKGQKGVQRMEDKAVADGKVTAKERRHIEVAQDKQSKKIYRQKHDKQHK